MQMNHLELYKFHRCCQFRIVIVTISEQPEGRVVKNVALIPFACHAEDRVGSKVQDHSRRRLMAWVSSATTCGWSWSDPVCRLEVVTAHVLLTSA